MDNKTILLVSICYGITLEKPIKSKSNRQIILMSLICDCLVNIVYRTFDHLVSLFEDVVL